MANQIYRGNSEQKLYNLTNNFVGGMNTVSVDEVTPDYQFRQLLNVDLRERGKLQNRKGFKLLSIFTDYIFKYALNSEEILTLLSGDVMHFSVLNDTNNFLNSLVSYNDIDKFKQDFQNTTFNFNLLLIVKQSNPQGVNFYNLNLRNEQGDLGSFKAELIDLQLFVSGVPKNTNLTGLKVAKVANLSYMVTSEMVEGGNQIVEINSRDNIPKVRVIDNKQHYYQTTPYDIMGDGYNLLAENPLTNVKKQGDLISIQGIVMVKVTNEGVIPLSSIPSDGNFTLYVMHTGDNVKEYIREELFYYNTATNEKTVLTRDLDYKTIYKDDNENDGILTYAMTLTNLARRDVPIHFRFFAEDDIGLSFAIEFASTSDADDYFNFPITTINFSTLTSTTTLVSYSQVDSSYWLFNKSAPYTYNKWANGRVYTTLTPPAVLGQATYYMPPKEKELLLYYGTIGVEVRYTTPVAPNTLRTKYFRYDPTTFYWNHITTSEYNTLTFKLVDNMGYVSQEPQQPNEIVIPGGYSPANYDGTTKVFTDLTIIENLELREPNKLAGNVKIKAQEGTPSTYYSFNNSLPTYTGVFTNDFALVDYTPLLLGEFTNIYTFGGVTDSEVLRGLDLQGVKALTIDDRLVLFRGNTLWFSVEGNPNYFPFKNYVSLGLLGTDEIVSINYFRGSHIIFTKERIYRLSGYFPDISITLINDSIGCISERSIKSFNNTLVFLTYDGLYRLKQNYYMEGLENVEKIDKNITNIYPKQASAEAFIYSSMYHLVFKDNNDFDTLKYYYDIDLPYGEHPYTIDKYAIKPKLIMQEGSRLFSLNNGELYLYDEGYTDFLPNVLTYTSEDVQKSTYHVTVRTINMMLGLPTHSKKFKNLVIKTKADNPMPLYITVLIDDYIHSTPMQYVAVLAEDGQIEYREILGRTDITTTGEQTSNLLLGETVELIDENQVLGNFTLGNSKLGVNNTNIHKMNISGKGQYVQFLIDQFTPSEFSILDIGLQYKVGKVRGD